MKTLLAFHRFSGYRAWLHLCKFANYPSIFNTTSWVGSDRGSQAGIACRTALPKDHAAIAGGWQSPFLSFPFNTTKKPALLAYQYIILSSNGKARILHLSIHHDSSSSSHHHLSINSAGRRCQRTERKMLVDCHHYIEHARTELVRAT